MQHICTYRYNLNIGHTGEIMDIFQQIEDYEQLVYFNKPQIGLKAIVCIHSTMLGPALGGCRLYPYQKEEEALKDVLRLAKAMTYKSAAAGLNWGGGKSVIIADPAKINREALFKAMGKFVEGLGGRYIMAEDMNVTPTDLAYAMNHTDHVCGLPSKSGDPSPSTALGVFNGIRAAVKHKLGKDSLSGLKVAIQGLGHVGFNLAKMLFNAGANLYVTDTIRLDEKHNKLMLQLRELHEKQPSVDPGERFCNIVKPEEILFQECDVLAPCAMGAVITSEVVEKLNTGIIAGGANNQIDVAATETLLSKKDILYAPDYVINSGGLITVSQEFGMSETERDHRIANIYDILLNIFHQAKATGCTATEAANKLAETRIRQLGVLPGIFNRAK